MSTPSLAPFIMKRPWLQKWMEPLSRWYLDSAGYRKLGLRYVETQEDGEEALAGEIERESEG
jgi:hypothetical protein